MTQRAIEPYRGCWCLPGGHIELFEKAQDAICREVKEETGLAYEASFLGAFDEIIPERNIHAVVLVYEGQAAGEVIIQPDEVMSAGWFSIDEALNLPLAFLHGDILKTYRQKTATDSANPL
jgi:8-oxo-dGTP diphosphatase